MPAIAFDTDPNSPDSSQPGAGPDRLQISLLVDRLIYQFEKNTPQSTTGARIIELTGREGVEFEEIEEVLRTDPVLVTKVFNLANSSLYAGNGSGTLSEACIKLGIKTIRNISVACSMSQSFSSALPNYQLKSNEFLAHSLLVALCSQALSKLLRKPVSFQADIFLAGLMHDIGKSLLDQALTMVVGQTGSAGAEIELNDAGVTHNEVGGKFAEYWKLPASVACVAQYHHSLEDEIEFAEFAAVVNLANRLVNQLEPEATEITDCDYQWNQKALDILELDKDTMNEHAASLMSEMEILEANANAFLN